MADELMFISNDDTQNNDFFRLKLVVKTFGHHQSNAIKVPKVIEQT